MKIDDVVVTRAIVERFNRKLLSHLDNDVVIAGGGPAGLYAAAKLAQAGRKVALFESKLSLGGGMWGGGIGYNFIVVQDQGRRILEEIGCRYEEYEKGYYTASALEAVACLIDCAEKAGAGIFNLTEVEDVMVEDDRITGFVINRSPITIAGLHVDPVSVRGKYSIEATGHPLEVLKQVINKTRVRLNTPSGGIEGEKSMNANLGEAVILENSREICPGLFVAGMASNAAYGSHRMGPIFGGMLLSGEAVAKSINELLG